MAHFYVGVILEESSPELLDKKLEKYGWEYVDPNGEFEIYRTKEKVIEYARRTKKMIEDDYKKTGFTNAWRDLYLNATTDEDLFKASQTPDRIFDKDGNELKHNNKNYKYDWYNGEYLVGAIDSIDFDSEEIKKISCFLDESGWKSSNTENWFIKDVTSDEGKAFTKYVDDYLKNPDNQDKFIAIVDCHV